MNKSFCSLLNTVLLGFASTFAFCCLVFTIFYAFDVTSDSSGVTEGAMAVSTSGVTAGAIAGATAGVTAGVLID